MTSASPPAIHSHVIASGDTLCSPQRPCASEIADAKRACEAQEQAGLLPSIERHTHTDEQGNVITFWAWITSTQAVKRCVQARINGDEESK